MAASVYCAHPPWRVPPRTGSAAGPFIWHRSTVMAELTMYHNPRCSKSREALALLQERGVEPELVRYLDHPHSTEALAELLGKLGMAPRELLRRGEQGYKDLNLADPENGRATWRESMRICTGSRSSSRKQ